MSSLSVWDACTKKRSGHDIELESEAFHLKMGPFEQSKAEE